MPIRDGWRRSAILVQTAIGKLQARRMTNKTRADASPAGSVAVFDDELEALNYLCGVP